MKPSEERYTAWVDGQLSAAEAAELERELGEALPDAEADRAAAAALGRLLREHTAPPPMPHADFFRHQLLETIRREEAAPAPAAEAASGGIPFWRLLWATAACAVVGCLLGVSLQTETGGSYHARILHAQPGGPGISAVPIHSAKANATVLWLDGLDYLAALPSEGRP